MTFAEFSDAVRLVEVTVSTLLIVALVRLVLMRLRRGPGAGLPNPESLLAVAIFLSISIGRRIQHRGEPGDPALWAFGFAVMLLSIGMLRSYRLHMPAWVYRVTRRDKSRGRGADSGA
jgi:hypothetical protein